MAKDIKMTDDKKKVVDDNEPRLFLSCYKNTETYFHYGSIYYVDNDTLQKLLSEITRLRDRIQYVYRITDTENIDKFTIPLDDRVLSHKEIIDELLSIGIMFRYCTVTYVIIKLNWLIESINVKISR